MLRSSLAFGLTFVIAGADGLASQSLQFSVSPPAGTPQTTFTFLLTNPGENDFVFDNCCAVPSISTLDGQKVSCPPCPLPPCDPQGGVLRAGRLIRFDWQPASDTCAGADLHPGIYDVHWDGFPDAIAARLEILPEGAAGLGAVPGAVRFGESVEITLKNTSLVVLVYNICCFPPSILDPWGLEALCSPCVDCVRPKELLTLEGLTFNWTPGMNACNKREYPGRYRLLWSGFFDALLGLGIGKEFRAAASVLVLPREDRRLDLELSSAVLHPGEILKITAENPLKVPIYRYLPDRCNDLILLDSLGREASCGTACPPYQALNTEGSQVILPGERISLEVRIPAPGDCGQAYGRWSVIWGRFFGLTPSPDPLTQVFGYGEINVVPPAFVRGDCDYQGSSDLADVVFLLNYLFQDGQTPPCLDACDFDDSGELNLTDALANLFFLFTGDPPPSAPFPAAGPDPTGDALGCEG